MNKNDDAVFCISLILGQNCLLCVLTLDYFNLVIIRQIIRLILSNRHIIYIFIYVCKNTIIPLTWVLLVGFCVGLTFNENLAWSDLFKSCRWVLGLDLNSNKKSKIYETSAREVTSIAKLPFEFLNMQLIIQHIKNSLRT